MKKEALFVWIFYVFLSLLPPTAYCKKSEHFMIEINGGYSFSLIEEYSYHWGYNFQCYLFKGFGIQWAYINQARDYYHDHSFYFSIIYEFRSEKIRRIYPYVSIGYGGVLRESLDLGGRIIKIGSGIKYRLLEEIKPIIVNLNAGLFLFFSSWREEYQHLSPSFGLEIGL